MKIGRLTAASVSIASMLALTACSTVGGTAGDSSSSNTGSAAGDSSKTMVTVVKVKGIAWFDRMDVGVKEWGAENGYDTRTEGGTDVAPEKQIQIIQDLIAQKPVAITVVPNSPEALSAVLEQARAQGIKVVSHEATGIKNVDADIEAFDNASYGVDIMKNLGECTGGTGKYVQFVGGLTAKTHMEWVEAAYDYQQKNFPNMERVETPIESTDNETAAYEKAKEVLGKYPDIKAFQGSARNDVPASWAPRSPRHPRSTWPPDRSTRSSSGILPSPARPSCRSRRSSLTAAPSPKAWTLASRVTTTSTSSTATTTSGSATLRSPQTPIRRRNTTSDHAAPAS